MNPKSEHTRATATTSTSMPYYAMRPVMVRMTPAQHKRLRRVAADAEMSMGAYVARIIAAALGDDV